MQEELLRAKVSAIKGTQLLIFPMFDCTVAAGYKNKAYKKGYGYVHYGVDFDSKRAVDFDVIASGKGTVVGTEKNNNSIGGVVVIRYDKVYNPTLEKVGSLIVRYYHLFSIAVKEGEIVNAYDTIGKVSGYHKWWNHAHVEIDSDTMHPFHTPQVSESASKMLVRKGANDKTMLDPMTVFVVGKHQKCKVHSLATYADQVKDAPKFEED